MTIELIRGLSQMAAPRQLLDKLDFEDSIFDSQEVLQKIRKLSQKINEHRAKIGKRKLEIRENTVGKLKSELDQIKKAIINLNYTGKYADRIQQFAKKEQDLILQLHNAEKNLKNIQSSDLTIKKLTEKLSQLKKEKSDIVDQAIFKVHDRNNNEALLLSIPDITASLMVLQGNIGEKCIAKLKKIEKEYEYIPKIDDDNKDKLSIDKLRRQWPAYIQHQLHDEDIHFKKYDILNDLIQCLSSINSNVLSQTEQGKKHIVSAQEAYDQFCEKYMAAKATLLETGVLSGLFGSTKKTETGNIDKIIADNSNKQKPGIRP